MKSSKYKHVYHLTEKAAKRFGKDFYAQITHDYKVYSKTFADEKEAAIWVDKKLISLNLPPVNIFKKV